MITSHLQAAICAGLASQVLAFVFREKLYFYVLQEITLNSRHAALSGELGPWLGQWHAYACRDASCA